MNTLHYDKDRKAREAEIQKIGYGKIIKSVIIDNGHKAGPAIHEISDTGIITIRNQKTKAVITKLIARPGQIRKYFGENEAPETLIEIAREHKRLALNQV